MTDLFFEFPIVVDALHLGLQAARFLFLVNVTRNRRTGSTQVCPFGAV
jgi:hypothetical protein